MGRNYLALDIEIAKLIPLGQDEWWNYRPLGITCAATYDGKNAPRLWYGKTESGDAKPFMAAEEVAQLVAYLREAAQQGHTILTWNGLGFDLPIIADESGLWQPCREVARAHCDMMFHIFCLRGHTLSLEKAAKGMGLRGKLSGMSGELAPRYWAEGKWAIVLDYVAQDARTTYDLAQKVEQEGVLKWISERSGRQEIPLPNGWLTVEQALALPLPDTSWMKNPLRRSKFSAWLSQNF
ncbi:MAG: ribonuclease H-like domain-containing protein [Anaerolineales bacterium]